MAASLERSNAAGDAGSAVDEPSDPTVRRAWWAFVVALALAAPLYAHRARGQWFFQDEWYFLATRDGGSLDGLLAPHNEHWTTVPVIAYRLLWNVFGLHRYEPYQAMSITVHLVVVVLVRAVARRAGAGPWPATLAASALLLYGTGSQNVVWAFQITFTGAVALGLGQLLLADAPQPSRRRTAAALACGLGALMCSGVGLIMVGTTGVAMVLRHGWRRAAGQVAPLAATYLAWYRVYGSEGSSLPTAPVARWATFAVEGVRHAVVALTGGHPAVAVVLAVGTAAGLAGRAWPVRRSWSGLRTDLALPVALAVGTGAFLLVTARARVGAFGLSFARSGRYSYVAVALLLPVLAVATDALARRWRPATLAVAALLLVGVPANVRAIEARADPRVSPATVLAVANADLLASLPADQVLFPVVGARAITPGWLLAARGAGAVPSRPSGDLAALDGEALARLAPFEVVAGDGLDRCEPLEEAQIVALRAHEAVGFLGILHVRVVGAAGTRSRVEQVGNLEPRAIRAGPVPLRLVVAPDPNPYPEVLCR